MEDSLSYLDNLLIVVIADTAEVYLDYSLRGKDGKRRNLLAVSAFFFKANIHVLSGRAFCTFCDVINLNATRYSL